MLLVGLNASAAAAAADNRTSSEARAQAQAQAQTQAQAQAGSQLQHVCEAMLLVDKVKRADEVRLLWAGATGSAFVDYSDVFVHDGLEGWVKLLEARRQGKEAGADER